MARTMGFEITQVRPHGFLYRQISTDVRVATVVAKAIAEFDRWLILIGASGTSLLMAGERAGIRVAQEAWIDRTYDAHGILLPHSHSRAIIKSAQDILNQASSLIKRGEVIAVDGSRIRVDFQTLHVHVQLPNAKALAEAVRDLLPNACALASEPFAVGAVEDFNLVSSL